MQMVYRVAEGFDEPDERAMREVADVLAVGGLALIPTETVYGVAVCVDAFLADDPTWPRDPEAAINGSPVPALGTGYRRIFSLKQRDLAQTVAWLVADERALDAYGVDVPDEARAVARAFWPGALTIVVKAAPGVPAFMRAPDGTVALRASASPVAQALIRHTASPLACTSSNTHGMPAPASFAEVEPRILDGVDTAIDAGETPCHDASTIVSFQRGELEILRQGALSAADIERVVSSASAVSASGSER